MDAELWELLSQADIPGRGQFSLDAQRARQVLEHSQLPDPYFYVLKWVQWAVLACATAVWVDVLPDRISVWHDGEAADAPSASELLSLQGEWGHFGSGFFAAARLSPSHIALLTRQGSRSLYGRGDASPKGVTVWGARRKLSLRQLPAALSNFSELSLLMRPEAALLRFHCQYAPVLVYLNGRCINRPLFGVSCRESAGQLQPLLTLADRKKGILRDYASSRELLPAPDWNETSQGEFTHLRIWGRPCLAVRAMYFYLPPGPKASNHHELNWVKDGVLIQKETQVAGFPAGLHAIASCQGLDLDASGFAPVHNAAYQRRIQEILEAFRP